MIRRIVAGSRYLIVVAVAGNTSPVTIPFSLNGFADGFAELQRAKASRTGFFSFLSR